MTLSVAGAGTSPASAVLHATLPFVVLDLVAVMFFLRRDISS